VKGTGVSESRKFAVVVSACSVLPSATSALGRLLPDSFDSFCRIKFELVHIIYAYAQQETGFQKCFGNPAWRKSRISSGVKLLPI